MTWCLKGSTWNEVLRLAHAVEDTSADIINTGIGWHEARIPTIATRVPRRAFTWITKKLMGSTRFPIVASNRINSPEIAEQILTENCANLVSMARPFLADAHFVKKAQSGQSQPQESESVETDLIVICAGQIPDHKLADKLLTAGRHPHVIGGAKCATKLDAKRAVEEGERLAATL